MNETIMLVDRTTPLTETKVITTAKPTVVGDGITPLMETKVSDPPAMEVVEMARLMKEITELRKLSEPITLEETGVYGSGSGTGNTKKKDGKNEGE